MELVSITHPDLTDRLDFAPGADVESWRLSVPAKGACYVLEDSAGRTVLLSTTADLRRALQRRVDPSVQRVRWRIVCSRFEADWAFLENARELLAGSYRKLVEHWAVHWVCVDPEAEHPRFTVSERTTGDPRHCFGPWPDAKAGRQVVEALEDVFDLCRYYPILVKSPHGQACAYKQMGRCPAPCDGTVTMEHYRRQVRAAAEFLASPRGEWVATMTDAMKSAAADQRFEEARRIKCNLDRAATIGKEGALTLADFRWLILQRGDRKGSVRAFFAVPGRVEFAGQIDVKRREEGLTKLAGRASAWLEEPVKGCDDTVANERVGLVGWHLLHADRGRGAFIPLREAIDVDRISSVLDLVAAKRPGEDDVVGLDSGQTRISETTRPG